MAKVGASLPPEQIPPGAAALLGRLGLASGDAMRLNGQQRPASPALLAEWQARTRDAATSWLRLAGWKRWRWSLCAWKHGDHAATPAAVAGDSGFRLYLRCWLQQRIPLGNQPISPCARRVWDQSASAFDFTP